MKNLADVFCQGRLYQIHGKDANPRNGHGCKFLSIFFNIIDSNVGNDH